MKPFISFLFLFVLTAGCLRQTPAPLEDQFLPPQATTPAPAETNSQGSLQTEYPLEITPERDTPMPPAETSPVYPAGINGLIEKAKADLAARLSIQSDQIVLIEATAVTWANGSLGCPQPGMEYAEVLTAGYKIILQAENQNYEYHTSTGTEVVYCTNPQPPVSGTPIGH